jgi:DNA-binding response OmpR family regulator
MAASSFPPLVFVVDDDPEVQTFLRGVLDLAGYRTRALESGTRALEFAAIERPALMILDIYLSRDDLDGYTIASRLREQPATAHTQIIFITGMDAPVHRTLSHGLGAIYLEKPFTADELLRAAAHALHRADGGASTLP